MKVMAAANCEQWKLVLLYQGLVLSVIEYALAILTHSNTQIDKLERIQNEAMRIMLGCTRNTSCRAMTFLLDFPTIQNRKSLCRARSYLRISADTQHPLHSNIRSKKGDRLKRGKSRMGQRILFSRCVQSMIYKKTRNEFTFHQTVKRPSMFALHLTENADCRTH
jgi:hypothetical protein